MSLNYVDDGKFIKNDVRVATIYPIMFKSLETCITHFLSIKLSYTDV